MTTSRMLARVLGRDHYSVLDTIKSNISNPAFKRGNLSRRDYSESGHSRRYEFLLTPRALDGLARIMRNNARERIAEAYAGAWTAPAGQGRLSLPTPAGEPEPQSAAEAVADADEGAGYADLLREHCGELGERLRKAEASLRMYTELYEGEKHLRMQCLEGYGRISDLYNDLLWRMAADDGGDTASRLAAHRAFRDRLTRRDE